MGTGRRGKRSEDVFGELAALRERMGPRQRRAPAPTPADMLEEEPMQGRGVELTEELVVRFETAVERLEMVGDLFQRLLMAVAPQQAEADERGGQRRQRPQNEGRGKKVRPFYADESVRPVSRNFLMEAIATSQPLEESYDHDDYEYEDDEY